MPTKYITISKILSKPTQPMVIFISDKMAKTATTINAVVKAAVDNVSKGVVNGSTISEKLAESKVFPKMVISMVAAGEGSGNLPDMLSKVSDFYSREVDAAISGLTSMIEPILIVGLGAIVTVVVLAIYLPIFQMATGIG